MIDRESISGIVDESEARRVVECTRKALADLSTVLYDISQHHPDKIDHIRKAFGTVCGELVLFEAVFIRLYPHLEYDPTLVVKEPP